MDTTRVARSWLANGWQALQEQTSKVTMSQTAGAATLPPVYCATMGSIHNFYTSSFTPTADVNWGTGVKVQLATLTDFPELSKYKGAPIQSLFFIFAVDYSASYVCFGSVESDGIYVTIVDPVQLSAGTEHIIAWNQLLLLGD